MLIQGVSPVVEPVDAQGPRLRLHLIGEFRALNEAGRSVLPASKKARALLCLIGMDRANELRRSVAASLLWSGRHKDVASNSLRQALYDLQFALGACGQPTILIAKNGRLMLRPGSTWIDVLHTDATDAISGDDERLELCRDLRDLDPALDTYLDSLWAEVKFRRALPPAEHLATEPISTADLPAGLNFEKLDRFPPTISAQADIAPHQLGWRMAVLPFRSLGAPIAHGISLGMAEEVSAALGRFRAPRVIASASFWDGTGPAVDALSRCRNYQLDYIIDGTIQVADGRVRVNVTLLDVVLNFEVIWSARFEGQLDDLFSLQDRIASETVAQVDPELIRHQPIAARTAPTAIAGAHRAVLSAIHGIFRMDRPRFLRAQESLQNAIALDPDYAGAHAWLAYWCVIALGMGWAEDPAQIAVLAGEAAERATYLDPLDARGLAIAGHVKAYLQHDVRAALTLHARAVELNPNLPIAWTVSAWSKIYSGDHATALRHAAMAQALSPRDPHIFFVEHAMMTAHLFSKNLEAAETLAELVMERNASHISALNGRLATLGHMGRAKEAAHYLAMLRQIEPNITVSRIIARAPLQPADAAYYAEGLREAGVPEA